jgi:predicted lipoprotein with Yx(FWY)xxD motif
MKAIAGTLVGLALITAACGSTSSSSTTTTSTSTAGSTAPTATISTAKVAGLGTILVNTQGHTLYMFVPDNKRRVTCVGSCAALWPPLKISGSTPSAGGTAKSSLIGSDPDPSGGRVATYAGWPLYTYLPDSKPGEATGQALNANGGFWYVLSPSGAVVHTKP